MIHFEAAQLQEAPQQVLENEGAKIANVREIVDCGPASVHLHFAGSLRNKRFDLARVGVVYANFVHESSGKPLRQAANERLYPRGRACRNAAARTRAHRSAGFYASAVAVASTHPRPAA